ncbi:hypothetical protein LPJ59_006991 [Coemansia sp. RSA 2399]|nr:hypothetical protein LPJ59_006991 [Coemansia sp. RSA 2399]
MDRRVEEDMVAGLAGGGGSMASERDMYDAGNSIPIRAVEAASSPGGYGGVVEPRIVEQKNDEYLETGVSRSRSSSQASTASRRVDQQQQQQQSHLSDADDAASVHSTKSAAQTPKYMILDPRKLMGMRLPNVLPRNSPLAESSNSVASLWRQRSVNSPERSVSEGPGRRKDRQGAHPSELPAGRPLYSAMHMHMVPTSSSPSSYSARDGHENGPPPLRRRFTSTAASSGAGSEEKGGGSSSSSLDAPPIVVRRATDDDSGDSNR